MTDLQGMFHFTRNAYRILGVLGNAPHDAIVHAADVMEASLKMGVTSTTAWDLPWVGNLSRTEPDMRGAVGRLSDPMQRIRERLFWFHEGETLLKGLNRETIDEIAVKWAEIDRPAARHDSTLLKLMGALILDPRFEDDARWQEVINRWKQFMELDDYWRLLAELEKPETFDPCASAEQIEALRAETLKLVVDSISGHVLEAASAHDKAAARRALRIFRMAGLPSDLLTLLEYEVLGPTEDDFYVLCSEVRRKCDDNVRKDGKFAEDNQRICREALARFDTEIEPALAALIEMAGKDSLASRRARERAAFCLHGLALNHVWAEEYDASKTLIARAKTLAPPDSLILSRIEETVASVTENAREKRVVPRDEPVIKLEPAGSGAGTKWLKGLIALMVLVIVVGLYLRLTGHDSLEKTALAPPVGTQSPLSETAQTQDELVARVMKDSAPRTAPPSPKDNSLKTPTGNEQKEARKAPESAQKASPPAQKPSTEGREQKPESEPAKAASTQKEAAPAPPASPVKKPTVKTSPTAAKIFEKGTGASTAPATEKKSPSDPGAAEKKGLDALKARVAKSAAALEKFEAGLEVKMKGLEVMEKNIDTRRSVILDYERQLKDGLQVDVDDYKKTVGEYNSMVRGYNQRLAEARKAAAEYDLLQKKHQDLSEQYRQLSSR